MEELKGRFPEGVDYAIVYDTTPFITESINEVFKALRDAVILVAIVVLVFLQNWRSAIIPLIAVPVAIIGTFAVMAAMGFSLNNLTLFGLVLAIGIVVDDAIVVVEAVEHHIEHGLSPRDATIKAMEQVSGPVIAVGLVLSAVFVPCAFITRHHGPVLPAVRADDCRLDGDLGVQLADAQPGADGAVAASARQGARPPLPWLAFVIAGGWLGWEFLTPMVARSVAGSLRSVPAEVAVMGWRRSSAQSRRRIVALAARIELLGWFFARSTWPSTITANVYTWIVGRLLACQLLVLIVYGGLLYLTLLRLRRRRPRVSFRRRTRAICSSTCNCPIRRRSAAPKK